MASGDTTTTGLGTLREEWLSGGRPKGRAHGRVLDATERLLDDTPFHDLTVEEILREADISRPTFYSYFGSKNDVAAVLYEQALDEMYGAFLPMYKRRGGENPEAAFRRAIAQLTVVWETHRAVLRVVVENRHTAPEILKKTMRMVDLWVPPLADQIERDRADGIAPPGGPARPLVLSLLYSTETTLYVAGLGVSEELRNEQAATEAVAAMWLGAIYGVVPAPRRRP